MANQESLAEETPKHAGGRPLAYATVNELEQGIKNYFDDCDPHVEKRQVENGFNQRGDTIWMTREVMTEQKPYTMSGLARHMGIDRRTLLNYAKTEQYFPTVETARERVHEFAESQLYSRNATGAQFSLKNNFDWKDRQEITGKDGASLMPIGLDSAIVNRLKSSGDTPSSTATDSAE